MKPCKNCACMVLPGTRCWSCGAPVPTEMPTKEAAQEALTNKLKVFVGRKNDAETREEIAEVVEDFARMSGADGDLTPSRSDEGFDLLGKVHDRRRAER